MKGIVTFTFILVSVHSFAQNNLHQFTFDDGSGSITISDKWIFVNEPEPEKNYCLFILRADTLRPAVIFSVINFEGAGFFWIVNDYEANLDLMVEAEMNPKRRRYMIKRVP